MPDPESPTRATGDHLAVNNPTRPRTAESRPDFADVLSAMPALWTRLLRQHVPDPTGRRCRACTTAGTGTPAATWPCRIRSAAETARTQFLDRTNPQHRWAAGTDGK